MNRTAARLAAALAALFMIFTVAACDDDGSRTDQARQSQAKFDDREAPDVTGDAEYQNYMRAQEDVYDDPASIIYCTVFPESPSSPIFTVPIAGKLTSSSTSYFPNQSVHGRSDAPYLLENQSVDGMYHGNPPAYRYGFTPGGQYVDFFNLPTFCTTQLSEFQKQTLSLATVAPEDSVTQQAEEALRSGDTDGAQSLLDGLAADSAEADR